MKSRIESLSQSLLPALALVLLLGIAGLTGCASYDNSDRPSAGDDRPTDPDRQQVEDINREIGRDTGLMR